MTDGHPTWTFADGVAGYVTSADAGARTFRVATTDGRDIDVRLTDATYGEVVRDLGEPFEDPGADLMSLMTPRRYVQVYGIVYPERGSLTFDAKHVVLMAREPDAYRTEAPDWWIKQIRQLAEFYLNAQFPGGTIDYSTYRTHLTLEGQKIADTRQETDTISRLIYGFATAYLLTGEDRYLEAAEKGTEYLRQHMRATDDSQDIAYWYHGIDVSAGRERKILASQFGDDYDAIPAYEQIYALAGPVQTFRVTGDPRVLSDARATLNLFDRHFLDRERGGFFSHIDPVDFDPRAESLGADRARKNWNSVGDHAPAYLINLFLATGDQRYADLLVTTADTIVAHFPDYEHSPFVQERFHEDWSHDTTWGWQQNRAVVGHNLKIAWNLLRIHHLRPHDEYIGLARKIAEVMPTVGLDRQRGGWYDVMERTKREGEDWYRHVWHDRKAWWQQEQAILAFLIMHGSLRDPEYLRLARESVAFYNANFPDQDNGGVYFNVLSTGIPYLTGTERLKGSHSMSGYHSFELCYLATVYTNLLITGTPIDLYFRPRPDHAFPDNLLRVAPDLLPAGSIRIEDVWINGEPWTDFDREALTVRLPALSADHPLKGRPAWAGGGQLATTAAHDLRVRVRIAPAKLPFDAVVDIHDSTAQVTLNGTLTDLTEPALKEQLDRVVAAHPRHVVLDLANLQQLTPAAARELDFAIQKLDLEEEVRVVGATSRVRRVLQDTGVWEELQAAPEPEPAHSGGS
jgi:mannose/cellobiose epimerase-like protein (N-acyl-D-glucosamine 2-epimerase family)/anti-anti-sigma regulatory factor